MIAQAYRKGGQIFAKGLIQWGGGVTGSGGVPSAPVFDVSTVVRKRKRRDFRLLRRSY